MLYTISKTIKKRLAAEQVKETLKERLRFAGAISDANGLLVVRGFNRNLGGINYVAVARFAVKEKDDRTTITADVDQKPSIPFFILLALSALTCIGMIFPIVFYYLGKPQVTRTIERVLNEVAEELE